MELPPSRHFHSRLHSPSIPVKLLFTQFRFSFDSGLQSISDKKIVYDRQTFFSVFFLLFSVEKHFFLLIFILSLKRNTKNQHESKKSNKKSTRTFFCRQVELKNVFSMFIN